MKRHLVGTALAGLGLLLSARDGRAADPPSTAATSSGGASGGSDAVQRFDSPLSTGSGVTLTATQSQQTLTVGFGEQISTALFWQLGLSGQAAQSSGQSTGNTTLFSTTNGISAGVSAKVGIGYSSFHKGQAEKVCNDLWANRETTQIRGCSTGALTVAAALVPQSWASVQQAEIGARAAKLAQLREGAGEPPDSAPTIVESRNAELAACAAGAVALSGALRGVPAATTATFPESVRNAIADLAATLKQPAPWESREDYAKREDAMAAALKTETALDDIASGLTVNATPGRTTQTKVATPQAATANGPTCSGLEVADKDDYDKYLAPLLTPRWDTKMSLNGLLQTQGIAYQPVDSTGTLLSGSTKTYVPVLPGLSIDVALFRGIFVGGIQLGYTRSVNPQYEQVCNVQTATGITASSCSQATVGEPRPSNTAFATVALALNPLAKNVGNLDLGVEVLGQFSTTDVTQGSSAPSLFGGNTWTYVVSVPFFVAPQGAPWGLRAGLAPQVTVPTQTGKDTSLSVLLFVGTQFGAVPGTSG